MKYLCPNCRRVLYNRRLKNCGFCGAAIPEELRFTPQEIAVLDRERAVIEEFRQRRVIAEEAADGEFHDPKITPLFNL
jgi:hypothetical protein